MPVYWIWLCSISDSPSELLPFLVFAKMIFRDEKCSTFSVAAFALSNAVIEEGVKRLLGYASRKPPVEMRNQGLRIGLYDQNNSNEQIAVNEVLHESQRSARTFF